MKNFSRTKCLRFTNQFLCVEGEWSTDLHERFFSQIQIKTLIEVKKQKFKKVNLKRVKMSRCFNNSDCLFFESCQNSTKIYCPGTCSMSGWFIEVIIWSSVAALCALIGKDDFFHNWKYFELQNNSVLSTYYPVLSEEQINPLMKSGFKLMTLIIQSNNFTR